MAGKFIVIDGVDGSGTTTQTRQLCEWLEWSGAPTVATCEPTEGFIGRIARRQAIASKFGYSGAAETSLLFAVDRLRHCQEIRKHLDAGRWVVSDRYLPSSIVYQGGTPSFNDWLLSINRYALVPDLTIILTVAPEVALARIRARTTTPDPNEDAEAIRQHADAYLDLELDCPLVKIDASGELLTVAYAIRREIALLGAP